MSAEHIEYLIHKTVYELLDKDKHVKDYDDTYTDTIAEIIEKMIIINTRQWYLEDQMGIAKTKEEICALKKKMDIMFKVKRPALINALDKMIYQVLKGKIEYSSEDLKLYKKE